MSEFKVYYLDTNNTIKSKYTNASSKEEAKSIIYCSTEDCIQTLNAEFTN